MTTGSVRGKCSAPQAGQARFQPWSATREACAAAGAEGVGRVPAEDALGGGGGAGVGGGELGHHRAQVAEGEALRQRRVDVAAVVEEGAGAGGGALPVGDAAGEARGAVGGAEEDGRVAGRVEDRGGHRQPGEAGRRPGLDQRLALPEREAERARVGGEGRLGAQVGGAVQRAPGEGYGFGVSHGSPRASRGDHAARPRRRQPAAIGWVEAGAVGRYVGAERLARAGAPPTRSGPEGSSRNGSRLGRCPASHSSTVHRQATGTGRGGGARRRRRRRWRRGSRARGPRGGCGAARR